MTLCHLLPYNHRPYSINIIIILIIARYLPIFGKAELGGPTLPKYFTSGALFLLYIVFLAGNTLFVYEIVPNPFSFL